MYKFEFEVQNISEIEAKEIEKQIKTLLKGKVINFKKEKVEIEEIDPKLVIKCAPIDYSLPTDEWLAKMDQVMKQVIKVNDLAKAAGTIAGRIIQIPMGDGYAYYQILLRNAQKVFIKVITGIGDDWVVPDLGEKCMIPIDRAEIYIMRASDE